LRPSGVPPTLSISSVPVSSVAAVIAAATSPSANSLIRAPVVRTAAISCACRGRLSTLTVMSTGLPPSALATARMLCSTGASTSTSPPTDRAHTNLRM